MSDPKAVIARHDTTRGTTRSYVTGFVCSLILTLAAYVLATREVFTGWGLVFALAALALVQLAVQLFCFLHLGREARPRWNLTVMSFAVMVVVILVFGSIWIMKNLQYGHNHGAEPANTDEFIIHDEGYGQ
jgi:cytochrome o ubiquinol oxidase operon protein cyoD